jgi:hypothetical protein
MSNCSVISECIVYEKIESEQIIAVLKALSLSQITKFHT